MAENGVERTPPATGTEAASPRRRAQARVLILIALVVWAIDQLVKNWVVANLPEGTSVPVIGEALQWRFVRNPGAAFSLASGATWIFTILAVVVVVVILWQLRRLGSRSWAIFFALLLGGVLGNLTDRLFREPGFPMGHVIDFIYTPWMMPAIYNIADIAIVCAMGLFVVVVLLGLPIDGSGRRRAGSTSGDETSSGTTSTGTTSTGTNVSDGTPSVETPADETSADETPAEGASSEDAPDGDGASPRIDPVGGGG